MKMTRLHAIKLAWTGLDCRISMLVLREIVLFGAHNKTVTLITQFVFISVPIYYAIKTNPMLVVVIVQMQQKSHK